MAANLLDNNANPNAFSNNISMIIDNIGRVGIGTVTPVFKLDVSGTANISQTLTVSTLQVNQPGAGGRIYLGGGIADDTGYRNSIITTRQYDPAVFSTSTELLLYKGDDHIYTTGQLNQADRIRLRAGAIVFDTYSSGQYSTEEEHISTVNARMVIDNLGRVGIGTTNPGFLLDVSGTANISQTLTVSTLQVNQPGSGGTIFLGGGSSGDANYLNSFIKTWQYSTGINDPTELLLYKGNEAPQDRIRLRAGNIVFDTMDASNVEGNEASTMKESIRMMIDSGGRIGVNAHAKVSTMLYVSTTREFLGVTTEAARFENGNFIARPLQTGNFT